MRKTIYNLSMVLVFLFSGSIAELQAQQFINVLQNPGTNTDLTGWNLDDDLGTGHLMLPDGGIDGTGAVQSGYVTTISQEIDLLAIGYSEAFLDSAPIVRFADWIKGSGAMTNDIYFFNLQLLDSVGNAIYSYNSYDVVGEIISSEEWQQITHNVVDYGAGLRKISISRTGWDAEADQTATLGVIMDATNLTVGNNLLNPTAATGDLSGWEDIQSSFGDGWKVTPWCVGCGSTFQTSFDLTTKSQTVNLLELGYTEAQLDTEPIIDLWEFVLGFDGPGDGTGFGDTHFMNIELRDGSGNVIESFESGTITCTDAWQWVGANFQDYGPGLREIYIIHGGQDTEYWGGHYGGLVDATQLSLVFPTCSAANTTSALTQTVCGATETFEFNFDGDQIIPDGGTYVLNFTPGANVPTGVNGFQLAGISQDNILNSTLGGAAGELSGSWIVTGSIASDANDPFNTNCGGTTDEMMVHFSPAIEASETIVDESVEGSNDGSISVSATGGVGSLTFSWSTGATTSSIDNLEDGDYTVTITDINECSLVETFTVQGGIVGIETIEGLNDFSLFPNPTDGKVTLSIELEQQMDARLEIYNIAGQLIQTFENEFITNQQYSIDLSNQADGMYVAKLILNNQVATKRILKNK